MEILDASQQRVVCKYFHSVVGCRFGNKCKFSHASAPRSEQMAPAHATECSRPPANATRVPAKSRPNIRCQWFLQGNCRYGSACRYSHELASSAAADADPAQVTCNICMEPINLFAILSGCDHSFCMPCIHKWRSDSKSNRSCPMCRATSEFILPSPVFVEKEEKQELIKSMLASKAKIPCKDWVKEKKCKFGSKCFYAHLDENGNDLKPQQLEEEKNRPKRNFLRRPLFSFSWREVFDDFSWGSDSDSDEYLDDYEDFEDIDDESLDGMYPRYATSY
jgi:E3 ubiquitin-protein ligase makorin